MSTDQVVIMMDEETMEGERRKEATELERIGSKKRDFFLGLLGFTRIGPIRLELSSDLIF